MFQLLPLLAVTCGLRDLGTTGIWIAIAVITASIVGLVTGGLSWIDNRRSVAAVIRGGWAFCGTVCLVLAIYAFFPGCI